MHKQDPFGDEHYGAWFLYAKGSGVWFNTGKTIQFDEHSDAYKHFGKNGNEEMCKAAAAAGYDTIIFVAHHDHVNYPCDDAGKYPYMNVEIVAVKLKGTYSCGAKGQPDAGVLRSGWAVTKTDKCNCDNALEESNCGRLIRHLSAHEPISEDAQTGSTGTDGQDRVPALQNDRTSPLVLDQQTADPLKCKTDADCAPPTPDCVVQDAYYAQCITCEYTHFQQNCGWWDKKKFLPAAETKCGFQCIGSVSNDCTKKRLAPEDPSWFGSCKTQGACLRVEVKSSLLPALNIGNSTRNSSHGLSTIYGFRWCIDHLNHIVYAKMNQTHQPVKAPYFAAHFEIDYPKRPSRLPGEVASCRFSATHWASGDSATVFQEDMLNCTTIYEAMQLPGPDGVTNATIHVE
jgi:hypothetical protein